jgi:hypothetical protein
MLQGWYSRRSNMTARARNGALELGGALGIGHGAQGFRTSVAGAYSVVTPMPLP